VAIIIKKCRLDVHVINTPAFFGS
jgi:hypothetical protein